jgi:hypothetical protein
MAKDIEIIKEAAKKASKKKEKPEDPNEVARKLRGLPKHHQVGRRVHAGLAVKGGAGYRGEVVKVDNNHTYIKIDKKRIVKAPHHLVSAHEEVVYEESKEEKKERLKREAERETRSFRKYAKIENEKEYHDEKRKHHHEHERKMHREEVSVNEDQDIKKTYASLRDYMKRRAKVARDAGNHEDADKKEKTAAHWDKMANEETIWDADTKKEREVSHFHIVNKSSGKVVGKAQTMKSARSARDRHDNKYGSYNHTIQPVFKEETNSEARMKVSNIGRPDDPPVNSNNSVLHRTLQIKHKIIDEGYQMKLFDVSPDLVKAVKEVMEGKKMSKDDIAALAGDKKKIDADDFAALRAGKHKHKHKKHHVKEEEILDEADKPDMAHRTLHAQTYIKSYNKALKTNPGRQAREKGEHAAYVAVSNKYGEEAAKKLKAWHSANQNMKEEVELVSERNKENKFKKDLYVAKKGKAVADADGTTKFVSDLENAFDSDREKKRENAKSLLKHFKKAGRAVTREEFEHIEEGFEIGKVYHIGKDEDRGYFIPTEVQKNGKHKGMQFDRGAAGRSSKKPTTFSYDYDPSWKKTPADEIPAHIKAHLKEEYIDEVRDPGSTYGVKTPLRKKAEYTSENGRHVAKVKRDRDWNEYRVELYTDGKHHKPADYHTDDKEEAHDNAKAMVAHAQKHEKPLSAPKATQTVSSQTGFTPKNEETSLVSKIINKYTK